MIFVSDIQAAVAEAHEQPVECMREPDGLGSRARAKVRARQEAMFLCRDLISPPGAWRQCTRASYPTLGKLFGGRDHATVIHAVQAVEQRIGADPEVRRRIDSLSVGLLLREGSHA